jgi:hypothetical protein
MNSPIVGILALGATSYVIFKVLTAQVGSDSNTSKPVYQFYGDDKMALWNPVQGQTHVTHNVAKGMDLVNTNNATYETNQPIIDEIRKNHQINVF